MKDDLTLKPNVMQLHLTLKPKEIQFKNIHLQM